jgi:hypothetical protein
VRTIIRSKAISLGDSEAAGKALHVRDDRVSRARHNSLEQSASSFALGGEGGGSFLIAIVRIALSYQPLDLNVTRRFAFVALDVPIVETGPPPVIFSGMLSDP